MDGFMSRKGTDDEAIIIRDKPGKIIGALLGVITTFAVAGVLGGVAFAYAQSGINGEVNANIESLTDTTKSQEARINSMDTKIDGIQKSLNDSREQQARMDTKLDLLLRSQGVSPAR
jgi:hypothetical protein